MRDRLLTRGLLTASLAPSSLASPLLPQDILPTRELAARALPANAPHGYTPQTNDCPPNTPSIREAGSLSDEETSWLKSRRQATIDPMKDLLGRLKISGLDTDQYIDNHKSNVSNLPNIGIAVSGGGYRAMLNGAGVIEAFDSRTPNSTSAGQLGGLLQSSTYLAGLSGGSWLVGSLYTNNYTSVNDILAQGETSKDTGDLWDFTNSIFVGPDSGDLQLLSSGDYYATLVSDTKDKSDAGFNITITDYWGRALSFQLVNAPDGGPDYTLSSIAKQDWFTSGSAPMPFIVSDGRAPGEIIVPKNTTVYDFSPFEFGSPDPTVYGFVPTQFLGTNFTSGSPTTDQCVTGFDNVGFVMGTSSSLFNSALTTVEGANSTGLFSTALQNALAAVLTAVGKTDNDIADYPNPFYGYHNDTNLNAQDIQLTLVDGGEDDQNIPFHPLIQPDRHVDVIFAVDSSADTTDSKPVKGSAANWPDGAALRASYDRSQSSIGNGTAFPSVPDQNSFFNLGLNNRPTFFGCDASNISGSSPLIVYLPNAPYVYTSNVSTFDLDYNNTERDAIVLNGYNLATQLNGTLDDEWPTCIGCAILSRSFDRTGHEVPDVCNKCFKRYCWDGSMDSSTPSAYVPQMKGEEISVTGAAIRMSASIALALSCAVFASMALL